MDSRYGIGVAGMLALATVIVMACSGLFQQEKMDLLDPSPCSPPCWQNITPGKTTLQEAVEALRASPWVDPERVQVHGSGSSYGRDITFEGAVDGNASVSAKGIVEYIYLAGHQSWAEPSALPDSIQIDDLVQHFGPPQVRLGGAELFGPRTEGRRTFFMEFCYPQLGWYIRGVFDGPRDADPPIPSSVELGQIKYTTPDDFYRVLQIPSECLVPWDGHREASYYCGPCCVPWLDP